jgi:hypothetical protein
MKRYQLCDFVSDEHLLKMSNRRRMKAIKYFMSTAYWWYNGQTFCWERHETYVPLSGVSGGSPTGNVGLSTTLVFPTEETARAFAGRLCPRSRDNENSVA